MRDRQRMPGRACVRHQDVELRAVARADAGGRGDVHAGVADRGRDLRQGARRVLDVDDEVDGHPCASSPTGVDFACRRPRAPGS
jgi:hypothetical protein